MIPPTAGFPVSLAVTARAGFPAGARHLFPLRRESACQPSHDCSDAHQLLDKLP